MLYFTDKKQTSAVLKALSKKYLNKLSFGEVRAGDELAKSFNVEKFPTLLVMTADYSGDFYDGEMKVD